MKSVLITGGSSGIGAAVAMQAVSPTRPVFIGYKTGRERAEKLAQNVSSKGSTWPVQLSLDTPGGVDKALDEIAARNMALGSLVLCAAAPSNPISFLKTTAENLSEQLRVSVIQNHYLIAQVWKRFFRAQGGGHVVGVLSVAAESPPWPHLTSYVTAKRGLQAVIECALAELAPSGLRASFIVPNSTETPMLMNQDRLIVEAARAKMPNGKLLQAEEVAEVVVSALDNPPLTATPAIYKVGGGSVK